MGNESSALNSTTFKKNKYDWKASKEKSDIEHLKEKGDNIVERIEEEKTYRDG